MTTNELPNHALPLLTVFTGHDGVLAAALAKYTSPGPASLLAVVANDSFAQHELRASIAGIALRASNVIPWSVPISTNTEITDQGIRMNVYPVDANHRLVTFVVLGHSVAKSLKRMASRFSKNFLKAGGA